MIDLSKVIELLGAALGTESGLHLLSTLGLLFVVFAVWALKTSRAPKAGTLYR